MFKQNDNEIYALNNHQEDVRRRQFLRNSGAAILGASLLGQTPLNLFANQALFANEDVTQSVNSENLVKKQYDSLSAEQKKIVCHDWEYNDSRGLLRTHVSNNWNITPLKYNVTSPFFTKDQQEMIETIFWGLYQPDWKAKIQKQLDDDQGGYGGEQSIAIFGEPGTGKFEFVLTGRHVTVRCDGDSTENMAFGGPIFYGHAAENFNETKDHPGNVFWEQALQANQLYQMLDGKQRKLALVENVPQESKVAFKGATGDFTGMPIKELSKDQQEFASKVLETLVAPYRTQDQQEVRKILAGQGGLEACHLSFYKQGDIGNDQVWDNWRLEGPSFVWHYRGAPHVHVWVNISSDATVPLNAKG
jgi:hypothetical protein